MADCPNCAKKLSVPDRTSKNKYFYIEFYTCDACGLRFEIVVHLESGVFKNPGKEKKDFALLRRFRRRPSAGVPVLTVSSVWEVPVCAANA